MLGIALGTSAGSGVLIRGFAKFSAFPNSYGVPLYIGSTAGEVSTAAPTGAGDVARVIGYSVENGKIYFHPDNTWVKRA